ncbi:MAG TPA: 2-C-methyl-D-erythritol 4-phosphate cytidylyltransferase [Acidimicrobiales bacterium]|nr:2-C-methyl-D-erythritol 4-phosphate cytidylyltransferase [Acidimicrobiales bacterium]
MGVWAIVVAAGESSRFGRPKQYAVLGGREVLDWSVDAARKAADGVVLVVPPGDAGGARPGCDAVVAGGSTRSASVRNGLAAVPDGTEVVVVHDAARPLAGAGLFRAAVDAVRAGAAAAVCAVPVTDTVKEVEGGAVVSTLDRARLWAVQTPQAFAAGALRAAHAGAGEATDDAALVEAAGLPVVVVPGDPANLKLTTPADLVMAEALAGTPAVRVGQGHDVHPFAADRRLVLGGVVFEGERGLQGHSDADVVAHAVADALLGAAGLGDLGRHFPDSDPAWAGADSIRLLAEVVRRVADAGWRPANADCTVVLERPRLADRRAEMEARLAGVLGAPVNVKATRPEGLGALGRSEGIACTAAVLLTRVVRQ